MTTSYRNPINPDFSPDKYAHDKIATRYHMVQVAKAILRETRQRSRATVVRVDREWITVLGPIEEFGHLALQSDHHVVFADWVETETRVCSILWGPHWMMVKDVVSVPRRRHP